MKEDKIYDEIYDGLNEMTYEKDIEEVEEYLKTFGELHFCDEKIDDGIDDDECEDEYVMLRSFDLDTPNGNHYYIRLYYGNNSWLFTYFDID